MVLRRACLLLLAVTGCLTHTPIARLPHAVPIAVAYVYDPESDRTPRAVPDDVKARVADALARRNLEVQEIPLEKFATKLTSVRDSQQRYREVAQLSDAPLVMLVELRVLYDGEMTEWYHWRVLGHLTMGRKDKPAEPSSRNYEDAAVLNYDHEREPQAMSLVAPSLAKTASELVDEVLAADVGTAPRAAAIRPTPRPPDDAIYFVLVDRFANGDPSNDGAVDAADPQAFHGGDLQGVLNHLDDLERLGVRTVWLSPVFKTRQEKFYGYGAFHGYWVEDLAQSEPRFGTVEKLAELSDALHRRGMRLMLDMVLNHVAFDSPLLQSHPDWFHHEGKLEDWNDPEQLTRRDVKGLPDLAQEKDEVYQYLLDTSLAWIDRVHPDGFRLDAVKHVPLSFWAKYDDAVHAKAGPDFELLGEELEGDPAQVARVQRDGHFDAMFDFPLHFALVDVFCKGQPPERLGAVLSNDRLYPDPDALVTLVDNHDLPRILSSCGGDVDKVSQALAFQLSARGTPSLTYGTEAGLTGEQEPENRADMTFGGDTTLQRVIQRGLVLRHQHPSLQRGVPLVLRAAGGVFAYARIAPEEAAIIVVNHRDGPARVELPPELAALSWPDLQVGPDRVRLFFAAPKSGTLAALVEQAKGQWRTGARRRDVDFVVRAAPKDGQVYVVGSGPELGAWNPRHALGPLDASGVARSSLPVGTVVEYKAVDVPSGSAKPRWEDGENHVAFVKDEAGPLRLELAWR
jgi:glycosidase